MGWTCNAITAILGFNQPDKLLSSGVPRQCGVQNFQLLLLELLLCIQTELFVMLSYYLIGVGFDEGLAQGVVDVVNRYDGPGASSIFQCSVLLANDLPGPISYHHTSVCSGLLGDESNSVSLWRLERQKLSKYA